MSLYWELPLEYVKKRMYNTIYKNGVRLYQFRKLERIIPQYIHIMGNRIKIIYTGQNKEEKVDNIVIANVTENQRLPRQLADPIDLGEAI